MITYQEIRNHMIESLQDTDSLYMAAVDTRKKFVRIGADARKDNKSTSGELIGYLAYHVAELIRKKSEKK